MIAAIVIPLLTLWQSVRDNNSLEKRIKILAQEIETLKQQRIVNP